VKVLVESEPEQESIRGYLATDSHGCREGSDVDRVMMAVDANCGLSRFWLTAKAVEPHRCQAVQNSAFGTEQRRPSRRDVQSRFVFSVQQGNVTVQSTYDPKLLDFLTVVPLQIYEELWVAMSATLLLTTYLDPSCENSL
jgi:hypothetical protein